MPAVPVSGQQIETISLAGVKFSAYAEPLEVCMRRLSASLVILASAVAFSQTNSQTNNQTKNQTTTMTATATVLPIPPATSGCPIGFFANRQSNLQFETASDAAKSGTAQGLHLILDRLSQPGIQRIEVTVYASSLKPRALLLNLNDSPDTISKTFSFERDKGSASLDQADVWMHKVGSVRWADLISITYADGTTWHPTTNLKCRAVPSNFLLVGAR
jgi:hypothetical protein